MRKHFLLNGKVVSRGEIVTRNGDEYALTANGGHKNSRIRLRTWLIGILAFLMVSLLFFNTLVIGQFRITHFINVATMRNNIAVIPEPLVSPKASGYLVNNAGCRIPAIDPLDVVSRRYMHKEEAIICNNGSQTSLIESNGTAIYLNPKAQYEYYNQSEKPNCCWRSFTRQAGRDNAVTYEKDCHDFQGSTIINEEFVQVECFRNNTSVYRDYHAFVPRKNKTEERCRRTEGTPEDHLSLLIVGLDAVSRLNFHRMMPKTVKALRNLEAIELLGYNKVGDNTYPNLVPVLTGLSAEELGRTCLNNSAEPFDKCPFLWKNFSDSGYRTIFAEDACAITTFNYLKSGFRDSPTDYYLRPFCTAAESDIGNNHKLNANLCLGSRKNFESLLHYTRKVAENFSRDRYFAFFWQASLTHDFFNYPQLGDDAYSSFFEHLGNKSLLNNTLLIVMSDHGIRWGEYRQTYQGRMEGSLPFVFFVFPTWWRAKYSTALANLRKNVFSLTTPFDLHETILDVLKPENICEESMLERNSISNGGYIARGISLFAPVPSHRTCEMAAIPEHWCMCHMSSDAPKNDSGVTNATNYLINELNRLVKSYPQCSPLKIKKFMDAKMWVDSDKDAVDDHYVAPWTDYTITIVTEPGSAIFEASIRQNGTSYKLVGSISRLNTYGKQSVCVDDSNMRLYCYCH